MKKIVLNLLLFIFVQVNLFAQTTINASVSEYSIEIGEPFILDVSIESDSKNLIDYPNSFKGFEILNSPIFDSVFNDNILQVDAKYRLTSFVADTLLLKAGPFLINGDTLFANEIEVEISYPKVDTAKAIKPIKAIHKPVYTWKDNIQLYIYIGIAIIVLAILIILFLWLRKRIKNAPQKTEKAVYIRPDIKAINALEEVVQLALYKQGKYKEHYTLLTDTLRLYFEEVLEINVFEKTTEELVQVVASTGKLPLQNIDSLRILLQNADLAKFAKYKVSENDIHAHLGIAKSCIEALVYCIEKEEGKE